MVPNDLVHNDLQMKALWNQRKIIISEKNQTGAAIYNLGSADSGMKP